LYDVISNIRDKYMRAKKIRNDDD